MKKSFIIFVLPRFSGGGAERVVLNLLTELHNQNHQVTLIVFDKSGPLLSLVPKGIPIHNLGTLLLKRSMVPLIRIIRSLKPKIIFSTLGYINVALLSIRWFLPRTTEVWVREANLPSISLPNNTSPKLMAFLYRRFYRKADRLIATSKRMRDEFISDFLVPEKLIEILPNPVDLEAIRSAAFPVKRFDKGGVCFIASGRLTYQKGFDRLLNWFSTLEDKNATLTILGEGELREALVEQAQTLSLQTRVQFIGFCDNPWQWYAGADLFLLSSRWEGLPNAVLESLACGTPVLATKVSGGIQEIAEQCEAELVKVVEGEEAFVEVMRYAIVKESAGLLGSLLPECYLRENVVSNLIGLMK